MIQEKKACASCILRKIKTAKETYEMLMQHICGRTVEDHSGESWTVSQGGPSSTSYFTLPKTLAEPIE